MSMTRLARYFHSLIRAELDAEHLAIVDAANSAEPTFGCATQDYIETNGLMYGAFCAFKFREPDPFSESDAALIRAAHTEAKAHGFSNQPPPF